MRLLPEHGRAGQAVRFGRSVADAYGRHASSQLAAAIAYRVLFSVVPFLAVLVSALDLFLPDDTRQNVIEWLYGLIPGTELEDSTDRILAGGGTATAIGLVSVATLLWASTGMVSAIRVAFRVIWQAEGESFVRGKLRDTLVVAGATLLVVGGFVLSLVSHVVVEAGSRLSETIGVGDDGSILAAVADMGTSLAVVFVALAAAYRFLAPVAPPLAHVAAVALAAAVAVQVVAAGFGLYVSRFADFDTVYGPIGAALAFLLLVYIDAMILLTGAEIIAGLSRPPGEPSAAA